MPKGSSLRCRETQTYNCCGKHYKRWRFVGTEFHPHSDDMKCLKCEAQIPWAEIPITRTRASAPAKAEPISSPEPATVPLSNLESAWRDLRATMKIEVPEFLGNIERHEP